MRLKINIYLLLVCASSYGQLDQYNYRRELKGVTNQWHKVVLPNEMFGKVSTDLSDVRIFGITAKRDTIEAPYILQLTTDKIFSKEVNFKILNVSHNEKGYYFTLEVPTKEPINQIKLNFDQLNFNWRLMLEGSQDQREWFTILENYRILSIKNELTDYQFTKVAFPSARYRFFRLLIKSNEKPDLKTAEISMEEVTDGSFRDYTIKTIKSEEDKQTKQTIIDISLESLVPVSYIKIGIQDKFDYYRPVTIECLIDSFKTLKGMKYTYGTLATGTLNSFEKNEFKFNSNILQKLRIEIQNNDNKPLTVEAFTIQGCIYELIARFTEPATYYLAYGNKKASEPHYDINRFADKIPDNLTALKLADEQVKEKVKSPETQPLFMNKIWLWTVLIVSIIILGWFSLKMIRKN